ncbi:MAG TPA: hypothetical protein PLQ54_02575 [Armatimonadota bacterium]|nr:hypothetical protein [Armatimonadota bacterium]
MRIEQPLRIFTYHPTAGDLTIGAPMNDNFYNAITINDLEDGALVIGVYSHNLAVLNEDASRARYLGALGTLSPPVTAYPDEYLATEDPDIERLGFEPVSTGPTKLYLLKDSDILGLEYGDEVYAFDTKPDADREIRVHKADDPHDDAYVKAEHLSFAKPVKRYPADVIRKAFEMFGSDERQISQVFLILDGMVAQKAA